LKHQIQFQRHRKHSDSIILNGVQGNILMSFLQNCRIAHFQGISDLYIPKCPSFSFTRNCTQNVLFAVFILKIYVQFAGEKTLLLPWQYQILCCVSRGFGGRVVSMLASGSNPAEAVRFFGRNNPQHLSFGGEVKPSVSCRRFAACKRSLNGDISAKLQDTILAYSSTFGC
jgi:hypothetical protein